MHTSISISLLSLFFSFQCHAHMIPSCGDNDLCISSIFFFYISLSKLEVCLYICVIYLTFYYGNEDHPGLPYVDIPTLIIYLSLSIIYISTVRVSYIILNLRLFGGILSLDRIGVMVAHQTPKDRQRISSSFCYPDNAFISVESACAAFYIYLHGTHVALVK